MNYKKDICLYGIVKTNKVCETVKNKALPHTPQEEIDFCLNCTKKRCSGMCREYREYMGNINANHN